MDIIEMLIQNIIDTKYENLPKEAIEATKKGILDTLGCIIGGASECQGEVGLVKEWGGKEESTILVFGGKVPAANAAWVNSDMAYALDYDGGGGGAGALHDLVCTIPTALAISEARGSVTGKEFITAITVGEDLAIRLGIAGKEYGGFSPVGIVMVFGTAAIAAKILGLDKGKMLNALGFAFVRGAGSHQVASDKVSAIRMLSGWSCRSGIEAALLAKRGLTGVKNILEGPYGFFNLFPKVEPNINALTDQLGNRFEITRFRFKKYPCCGTTWAASEAALKLVLKFNIAPENIKRITVETAKFSNSISGHPLTFDIKDTPEIFEAQFSQPYTVANAILRKSLKLEHFTLQYILDRDVIKLAKKVHPAISKKGIEEISALVEIEMQDGTKYSKIVNRDEIQMLSTSNEIKKKFRECANFASESLPKGNFEKIIDLVDRLEEVNDISELVKLLVRKIPGP